MDYISGRSTVYFAYRTAGWGLSSERMYTCAARIPSTDQSMRARVLSNVSVSSLISARRIARLAGAKWEWSLTSKPVLYSDSASLLLW